MGGTPVSPSGPRSGKLVRAPSRTSRSRPPVTTFRQRPTASRQPDHSRTVVVGTGTSGLAAAAAAALARGAPPDPEAPAYPGARVPGRRDWEQAQKRRRR